MYGYGKEAFMCPPFKGHESLRTKVLNKRDIYTWWDSAFKAISPKGVNVLFHWKKMDNLQLVYITINIEFPIIRNLLLDCQGQSQNIVQNTGQNPHESGGVH